MVNWMLMIPPLDIQILLLRNSKRSNWSMKRSKYKLWQTIFAADHSFQMILIFSLSPPSLRCCCFFKRKKKKSSRQKWLEAVQCSPEREAVTLLRATSHSNSRDSVLNPSQDYVHGPHHHQSHTSIRYHPTLATNNNNNNININNTNSALTNSTSINAPTLQI